MFLRDFLRFCELERSQRTPLEAKPSAVSSCVFCKGLLWTHLRYLAIVLEMTVRGRSFLTKCLLGSLFFFFTASVSHVLPVQRHILIFWLLPLESLDMPASKDILDQLDSLEDEAGP